MSASAALMLLVAGFLAGVAVRSQWKGRKVRFYPVPVPVVRFSRRPAPVPTPVPAEPRGAPPVDLGWRRTAVYLFFDRHGVLLYVGIAVHPSRRARQHAGLEREQMKVWWPDVAAVEAWWFHDRYVACAVEWALIKYLRPVHNRAPGGADDAYCEDRPDITAAGVTLPPSWPGRARGLVRGRDRAA